MKKKHDMSRCKAGEQDTTFKLKVISLDYELKPGFEITIIALRYKSSNCRI